MGIFDNIFFIALPLWIIFPFLAGGKPTPKSFQYILPKKITLDEDSLECEGESFGETRSVSDIKEIIDCGEWYQFVFYFPHKSNRFYCQKDLLVQGTIEEFEALFEGKIVQKYKK